MEATLIFGWSLTCACCAAGVAPSTPVLAASILLVMFCVIASCTTPAGASAISFTSAAVRTSLTRAARDCNRMVVGPWKLRNSRSPHIVRRLHVRIRSEMWEKKLYVLVFFMFCTNFEEGKKLPSCVGIWNLKFEDLKRYGVGRGEGEDVEYARMFEG